MIKKLQLKFVLLTMLSLLLVLAVIIAGMNIVSYRGVVGDADELLELLSENKGHFPDFGGGPPGKLPHHMSPEIPYETRFFTVTTDAETGKVIHIDTGRIAAVNASTAREFAQRAEGDRGFVEQYRFLRCRDGGEERIVFLDCGRKLDAFRNFLTASISISLAGYLLVFLLVFFLSHRVVRPISESYEKQKRFITDAGHELKTPLTIIRADTDVLELEQGENEWLSDIRRQTDRLASLTENLIYLSRLEETDRSLPMLDFALSDVVSETAHSFLAPAQTRNQTLALSVTPALSLRGNEKALRQLVSTLLDNALKYSPEGSSISLSLEKQGKALLLTVTNPTVETPSRQQLAQFFDRFYRGDSARSAGGHGIGLSVAKAVVTAHGGRITADAPKENTLRITATFPQ